MKATDNFIDNTGKSTEKAVIEYNAFTGEQGKSKHPLTLTREDIYWIVSFAMVCGFAVYLALKVAI